IVWDIERVTGQLRAYDASDYGTELYNSSWASGNRDALGTAIKFTVPTVSNGHVYVGTANTLVIYGELLPPNASHLGIVSGATWQLDANGNFRWDQPAGGDGSRLFFTYGGTALVGDWSGVGHDDVAIYSNGSWLFDWNDNGKWDTTAGGD